MKIEATVGAEAEIILRAMSPNEVAAVSSLHLSPGPHGWNTQQWGEALINPGFWVLSALLCPAKRAKLATNQQCGATPPDTLRR